MITKILDDLYCIELPLPRNPLKSINVYVIKGHERNLIIDTGMNRVECKEVLFPGLKEIGIDLSATDIFVSHLHSDHFGLVGDLARDGTTLYFSQPEASIVTGERHWADLLDFYLANGFPDEALQKSVASHPGFLYSPQRIPEITIIRDKQVIEVGDYRLECIETPGHSPGHMCLYEANKKIFFSGDHILFDITPNISYWPELDDALGAYLSSLEKVKTLDVKLVLPGHRKSWHHHAERIKSLNEHHGNRLTEALSALDSSEKTAYDIAPYITWKIEYSDWEQFPPAQKWFAVGETIAHLHYLEKRNKIKRRTVNGKILFSRT